VSVPFFFCYSPKIYCVWVKTLRVQSNHVVGFVFIFLQNKYVIIEFLLCNSNVQSAVVFFSFFSFHLNPSEIEQQSSGDLPRTERGKGREDWGETYEDGGSRGSIHLPPLALSLVQQQQQSSINNGTGPTETAVSAVWQLNTDNSAHAYIIKDCPSI